MYNLMINGEKVPHGQQQPQHTCGGNYRIEGREFGVSGREGEPDRENPGRVPGPLFMPAEWDRDHDQGVQVEDGVAHEQNRITNDEHQTEMV